MQPLKIYPAKDVFNVAFIFLPFFSLIYPLILFLLQIMMGK
ncbi:hypothetical protein HMPREF0201_03654 [Cedecea davisae DSM 4568]|uniref:Uncharacterized protein n=1 Tax=Cedecea davisae DSM 4568 TaxID=566551 RepID=S3IQY5_9ENTR|nr:hypothetical protein HMPREF0201_03654 [Cedecea davisae DSM 4568]